MLFHEKLDFLMNISNATNSAVAKYSAVDSSYISRLRRGERKLPKGSYFVESMSTFFAKQCNDELKKNAVLQAMGIPSDTSTTQETLSKYINQWLTQEGEIKSGTSVATLLTKLSNIEPVIQQTPQNKNNEYVVFYGPDGKRQAAITLLNLVLQSQSSQDLLLYSDENPQWLMNNSSFSTTWTELITKIVNKGNQIKVIHKVSRDINEMLNVIDQWLPLYLSGNVEPYYYPNLRDGVYKRTLYVAPGLAAITSSSIGDNTEGAANIMMMEKSIVDSFTNEFYNYLSLCKPLLMVHTTEDALDAICRSLGHKTNYITQSDSFFFNTIPLSLHKKFLKRGIRDNSSLKLAQYTEILSHTEEILENNQITNLCRLPSLQDVRDGKIAVCMSKTIYGQTLYYTEKEFKEHLENILHLLCDYSNYKVFLIDDQNVTDTVLCISDNHSLLLHQVNIDTVLEITEPNMLLAFSHYAVNSQSVQSSYDREQTINKLKEFLSQL